MQPINSNLNVGKFCQISLKTKRPLPSAHPRELRTLGDHLRKRRLDLKLLQREVAQILGVNSTSINNWENNLTSPKVSYIPRIIEFLGYVPYKSSAKPLGEKRMTWRRFAGFSQKGLALYLGVDPGTLKNWEKGKHQPPGRVLKDLNTLFSSHPSGVSGP